MTEIYDITAVLERLGTIDWPSKLTRVAQDRYEHEYLKYIQEQKVVLVDKDKECLNLEDIKRLAKSQSDHRRHALILV